LNKNQEEIEQRVNQNP